jgi:hypothetical protein
MRKLLTLEHLKSGDTDGRIVKAFDAETKSTKDVDGLFWMTMTTANIDLAGDVIRMDGWDTDHWEKKNPVILWSHMDGQPSIGLGKKFIRQKTQMKTGIDFVPRDINPFAGMIGDMAHGGYIKSGSVGYKPLQYELMQNKQGEYTGIEFISQRLLEFSLCNIGCNPDAVAASKSAGIDMAPMYDWCEKMLDSAGLMVLNTEGLDRDILEAARKAADPKQRLSVIVKGWEVPDLSRIDKAVSEFENAVIKATERIDALAAEYSDFADCGCSHSAPAETEVKQDNPAVTVDIDIVAEVIKKLAGEATKGK